MLKLGVSNRSSVAPLLHETTAGEEGGVRQR
jgi:hypothetical protein